MATIVTVHFDGGPEGGTQQQWTVPPPLPATVNWGGDVYELAAHTRTEATYRFNAEATRLAAPGLSGVTAAWTRLMRALGHKAPSDLRRITTSAARIRRMTRQHR